MTVTEIKTIDELKVFLNEYCKYLKSEIELETLEDLIGLVHHINTNRGGSSIVRIESDDFITLGRAGIKNYLGVKLTKGIVSVMTPLPKNNTSLQSVYKQLLDNQINFTLMDKTYTRDFKNYDVAETGICLFVYNEKVISENWINSSEEMPKKIRKIARDIEAGLLHYNVCKIDELPKDTLEQFYAISKEWASNKKNIGEEVASSSKYLKSLMTKNNNLELDIYAIPLYYQDKLISLSIVEVLNRKIAIYSEYKNVIKSDINNIPAKYINNAGSVKYYLPIKALIGSDIVDRDFQLLDEDGGRVSFSDIYAEDYTNVDTLTKYKLKHNPLYMTPVYIVKGIIHKRSIF